MAHDDSTHVSDELRRRAEANVETAELDVQRSDEAVQELSRTLNDFRAMWDRNGFGEDIVRIFRSPARGRT